MLYNVCFAICCTACAEAAYNAENKYVQHIRPIILNVGDNITLVCKNGHRLVAGNLTRVCQENGSLSGKEAICKRNNYDYLQI